MQRILRKDMLDVGNEQFLMLLFVMNAECDNRFNFIQQFLRSGSDKVFNLPINAFALTSGIDCTTQSSASRSRVSSFEKSRTSRKRMRNDSARDIARTEAGFSPIAGM